jgi:CCR4-NOT transcription complex subunit 6
LSAGLYSLHEGIWTNEEKEIEAGQYDDHFLPQLKASDYDGIFFPKSRARTMGDAEKKSVDGCATFWKTSKFSILDKHLIEFQRIPMERSEFRKSDDMFNRVTLRDNVAVLCLLENVETKSRVVVGNAHLHWDPSFSDVKLIQTAMLTDEISRMMERWAIFKPTTPLHRTYQQNSSRLPLLIAGDFNSTPDSGVYEFMTRGTVMPSHDDFLNHSYYNSDSAIVHKLNLKSVYSHIDELEFTNYTPTFKGTIDYIWYNGAMGVNGLLGNLDVGYLSKSMGFPSCHHPSDHVPIMAEVRIKPAGSAPRSSIDNAFTASFGNIGFGQRPGGLGVRGGLGGSGLGGLRKK